MIGILIVSHAGLGETLIETSRHVLGIRPARLEALGFDASADLATGGARIADALRRLDDGSGVLVLVDVFGATPANLVCHQLVPGRIEAVAGANLPMLLRAIGHRDLPLVDLLARTVAGGREGVLDIGSDPCRAKP